MICTHIQCLLLKIKIHNSTDEIILKNSTICTRRRLEINWKFRTLVRFQVHEWFSPPGTSMWTYFCFVLMKQLNNFSILNASYSKSADAFWFQAYNNYSCFLRCNSLFTSELHEYDVNFTYIIKSAVYMKILFNPCTA